MAPRSGERRRAVWVSAVLIAVVTLPGLRLLMDRDAGDGFPLSTYPMFDEDPGQVIELPTVVAMTGDGVRRLSPQEIAGTDQVIQAWEAVRTAVAAGPGGADDLCEEIAARVDAPASLDVVIEKHDTLDWSSDTGSEPLERRTLARCEARG